MVTIYNIQDLELFFDSINDFENPVTIQTKKGQYSQDLRNNTTLQEVLISVAGEIVTFLLSMNKQGRYS